MILETYLNENRLLEVNQIEFDKMINENTYYLTEGFTDTIKSIGNKIWEGIKKLFQKIIDGLKWIKSKTIDKVINFFKSRKSLKKNRKKSIDNIVKEKKSEAFNKAFDEKIEEYLDDGESESIKKIFDDVYGDDKEKEKIKKAIEHLHNRNNDRTSKIVKDIVNDIDNDLLQVRYLDIELFRNEIQNFLYMNIYENLYMLSSYPDVILLHTNIVNIDNNIEEKLEKFVSKCISEINELKQKCFISWFMIDKSDLNKDIDNKEELREYYLKRINSAIKDSVKTRYVNINAIKEYKDDVETEIDKYINNYISDLSKEKNRIDIIIKQLNDTQKRIKKEIINGLHDTDNKNNLSEKQLNTIEQGFMKIFTELLKTVNELLIEIDFKIKTDSSILAKYSEIEIIEDKDIDE